MHPLKGHRVAEWIKLQDPSICCLEETYFEPKDTPRLKVKGWRSIFHANGPQKKAGVVILISDKIGFKLKMVVRDTGQYIILKWTIHQEDLITVNIYSPSRRAASYIRKLLIKIKSHIDLNTLIGDLNMHSQ